MRFFHHAWILSIAFYCALVAVPVAHAEFFEIEQYQVSIKIQQNSVLDVEEVIYVHFKTPRHGIIRKIPYRYAQEGSSELLTMWLYDIEVAKDPWHLHYEDGYANIKIGSSTTLVSGDCRYTIRYKVYGGLRFLEEHSELYWNAVGLEWDVPIHQVSVRVIPPSPLQLGTNDYFVHTGPLGSTSSNATARWDDGGLSLSTVAPLHPKEGVTFLIKFPKDYLQDGDDSLRRWMLFREYGGILLPFITLSILYPLWRKKGRDVAIVKMVQFSPPSEINAAEASYLYRDRESRSIFSALILSWATQGVITIKQVEGSQKDIRLNKISELPKDARPYEHTLFNAVFKTADSVEIKSLRKTLTGEPGRASGQLAKHMGDEGLYEPKSRGIGAIVTCVGVVCLAGPLFWRDVIDDGVTFFTFICGSLSALLCFFFGWYMPKKTKKGARIYQHLLGFKEFIKRVEEPQLRAFLKADPLYFDKTFPFAMALGLATEWSRRFEGILSSPPSWYSGSNMGDGFESFGAMGDSLSSSLSSISNDSSSGGSSGGGGGGGGGSSW